VSWKSSKKRVVSVNSKGVLSPKKTGKAIVTGRAAGGKKAKCTVTVKYANVKSISISPVSAYLDVGDNCKLKIELKPFGANPKVKYYSDNESVAIVNSKGNVTAIAPGTAVITAEAHNGKKARCEIIVDGAGEEEVPTSVPTPAEATPVPTPDSMP